MIVPLLAKIEKVEDALGLYDRVQFYRAPDAMGVPGTWEEITSEDPQPAKAYGTVAAPWDTLPAKVLTVTLSGGDARSVTFAATDTELYHALVSINAVAASGATESDLSAGKVQITTSFGGTGATILLSGTACAVLGLPTTLKTGLAARPRLAYPTLYYRIKDFGGTLNDWYKWRLYSYTTGAAGPFSDPWQYNPDLELGSDNLVTGAACWIIHGTPAIERRVRAVLQNVKNYTESARLYTVIPGGEALEALTNERGLVSLRLYKGMEYTLYFEGTGFCRTIRVPDTDFDLMDPAVATAVDPFGIVSPEA